LSCLCLCCRTNPCDKHLPATGQHCSWYLLCQAVCAGCYRPCVKQPYEGLPFLSLPPIVVFVLGAMIPFHFQLALATMLWQLLTPLTHVVPHRHAVLAAAGLAMYPDTVEARVFLWLCATLPCHVHVTQQVLECSQPGCDIGMYMSRATHVLTMNHQRVLCTGCWSTGWNKMDFGSGVAGRAVQLDHIIGASEG
jgi:hypothetical protein